MARDEPDRAKRAKLDALQLSKDEWDRVKLFLDLLVVISVICDICYSTYTLLQHADRAQQAFSSDEGPSLHSGLPALEALHKAWSSRAEKEKYSDFQGALNDAAAKIAEYYDKTSTSDAFIFAMRELGLSEL
jgi:hypothetical protein